MKKYEEEDENGKQYEGESSALLMHENKEKENEELWDFMTPVS